MLPPLPACLQCRVLTAPSGSRLVPDGVGTFVLARIHHLTALVGHEQPRPLVLVAPGASLLRPSWALLLYREREREREATGAIAGAGAVARARAIAEASHIACLEPIGNCSRLHVPFDESRMKTYEWCSWLKISYWDYPARAQQASNDLLTEALPP